jgi:hypothetical protein
MSMGVAPLGPSFHDPNAMVVLEYLRSRAILLDRVLSLCI